MYFKKKKLIEKYSPDYKVHLYLLRLMEDDEEFYKFYRYQMHCELRFINRIKKLK